MAVNIQSCRPENFVLRAMGKTLDIQLNFVRQPNVFLKHK